MFQFFLLTIGKSIPNLFYPMLLIQTEHETHMALEEIISGKDIGLAASGLTVFPK